MCKSNTSSGNTHDTINTKAVPIHEDDSQPATKEVGTGVSLIAQTINSALAPLKKIVWGYEQVESLISFNLTEKLKDVPVEDIIPPKANIAGPALEALRYLNEEEHLREMFASLLAIAMDKKSQQNAHPAFVEVLKNISSDEAQIINYLANDPLIPLINIGIRKEETEGTIPLLRHVTQLKDLTNCAQPSMIPSYLDNLERLGLISLHTDSWLAASEAYTPIFNMPEIIEAHESITNQGYLTENTKGYAKRTNFGAQFCMTCVLNKAD